MSDPILALLLVVAAAWLVLAVADLALKGRARVALGLAGACLAGFAALITAVWLALVATPLSLLIPAGPPGMSLSVALDPAGALVLAPVLVAGAAILGFAAERGRNAGSLAAPMAALAGVLTAILAADAMSWGLGMALAAASLWSIAGGNLPGRVAGATLGLVLTVAILSPGDAGFARIAGPDSFPATLAILPLLAGPVLLLGFATPTAALPAIGGALYVAAIVPALLVAVLRVLGAPGVAAPPCWWAVLTLLTGTIMAATAGWRATRGEDLDSVALALCQRLVGLAVVALGLVLLARALDLPALGGLAIGALSLIVFALCLCGGLALLAAEAVRDGAGSRRLDRLGGVIHGMPASAAAMLAALVGLSALPPGLGFAALWLMAQAAMSAPRAAGLVSAVVAALLILGLAASAALATVAVVRVFGMAFLGRARLPRSSAAQEVPAQARPVLIAMTVLTLLAGVLPASLLRLLAAPAVQDLAGSRIAERMGLLALSGAADMPGYLPLPLLVLAVGIGLASWLARPVRADTRQAPAWTDGFAPPPAWLPFGDPLTQTDGSGFVPDLPRPPLALPRPRLRWRPPTAAWVMLGAAVVLLLLVGRWA